MTNEQLATFIHAGGNDELIPLLWDKVKQLLYSKAENYYRTHTTNCKRRGVEVWDIKQAAYCAYREALRYYNPDKGYKFITFIILPFKKEIYKLLDIQTKRGLNEPLNNSCSLDTPVTDTDGDTDTALIDLQADESSTDFIEEMEAAELRKTIRAEVEKLPEKQADIIKLYYLQEISLQDIAKQLQVSAERVRQNKAAAERALRNNTTLQTLYDEYYKQKHYFFND